MICQSQLAVIIYIVHVVKVICTFTDCQGVYFCHVNMFFTRVPDKFRSLSLLYTIDTILE